ncbi:hypothetical protein BDP81DRAFT_424792 [Colletotrichum phormii]|uniref:Uncharacterized protein n=1 Tax=Colletotrichum phormii TaxID=359342 RepID=A0AAI9ZUB2_9PEZI|nr:uncharacterized protein BDP81DRAFT_424792 [Colletotrichum phormii]KAK1638345.1 hypothetical protein BDP81DRAFT_424792 [Colletotrichum phormii]
MRRLGVLWDSQPCVEDLRCLLDRSTWLEGTHASVVSFQDTVKTYSVSQYSVYSFQRGLCWKTRKEPLHLMAVFVFATYLHYVHSLSLTPNTPISASTSNKSCLARESTAPHCKYPSTASKSTIKKRTGNERYSYCQSDLRPAADPSSLISLGGAALARGLL